MAITSQVSKLYRGDTLINDWQQANLLYPSAVKPVISTIEKSLVIRKFGELSQQDKEKLQQSLKDIIEFETKES